MLWAIRLCFVYRRPLLEILESVTAAEIALWQALVEIDGPWWGEREAAHLRQLCATSAAAAGQRATPDDYRIEWRVGASDEPAVNLLTPEDGLALFAARHGLDVTEVAP